MSQRHLVMPRGINVGTRNRVPMAELRAKLAGAGCTDVVTLLQSGNVILTSPESTPAGTAELVEKVLASDFGVPVRCIARTAEQIQAVLAANPLREVADDGARYLVSFLSQPPDPAGVERLLATDFAPEVLAVKGSEAYVWTPEGVKAMKLSYTYLEKQLGVVATARNWNTVEKIAATF